jgi:hypothetical protein
MLVNSVNSPAISAARMERQASPPGWPYDLWQALRSHCATFCLPPFKNVRDKAYHGTELSSRSSRSATAWPYLATYRCVISSC